jgi:hypothetical protein
MPFEFPRNPNSSMNLIELSAMRTSVTALTQDMAAAFSNNRDFSIFHRDESGYNIPAVLQVAAVCAFLKGISPDTDYDAALVKQALRDYEIRPGPDVGQIPR